MNKNSSPSVMEDQSGSIAKVYRGYYAKLYKYILYRVGDPAAAEDLVSEVFAKVLAKYHSF